MDAVNAGHERVLMLLGLSMPTACFVAASNVLLSDVVFALPGVILKRMVPLKLVKLLTRMVQSWVTCTYTFVHGIHISACLSSVRTDVCERTDMLSRGTCVAASIMALVVSLFMPALQRTLDQSVDKPKSTTRQQRMLVVAPVIIGWIGLSESSMGGVIVTLMVTCTRIKLITPGFSAVVRMYVLAWKMMVMALAVMSLLGRCVTISRKMAVGGILATLAA